MISDLLTIRTRFDEVDQMGYVYHANYVKYCHQGRTELLRKFGVHDQFLEENGIMLPVIEMNLEYKRPAHYDEVLTIKTSIPEIPKTRFFFNFEIRNEKEELICNANSTIVFVDKLTRKPQKAPEILLEALFGNTKLVTKNFEY